MYMYYYNLYHFVYSFSVLQKYYVGELINSDVPTFPTRGWVIDCIKYSII